MALHIDGVYTRTDDFPVGVRINSANAAGVRPLPEWGDIVQIQRSEGAFYYKALLLRLDRRLANRYQYMLSYTLAKQTNSWTGNNFGFNITDADNPSLDDGPFDADRRHALVVSGAMLLPYDVTFGVVWGWRSTGPFSALAGVDLNRDGANTDYVPGTTRNIGNRDNDKMLTAVNAWRVQNGRAPIPASQIDDNTYNRMDMRASKSFLLGGSRKLELIAQLFNVFGADSLGGFGTGWVTNALSDTFGRITSSLPRQQAEVAVRFAF
jgi:hypothetical protein